ncbi:hypothetical protein M2266_005440 [Streptomyces sp. SPB162]|nr:hypothetical protein [Streptomyces sp. SPB162]
MFIRSLLASALDRVCGRRTGGRGLGRTERPYRHRPRRPPQGLGRQLRQGPNRRGLRPVLPSHVRGACRCAVRLRCARSAVRAGKGVVRAGGRRPPTPPPPRPGARRHPTQSPPTCSSTQRRVAPTSQPTASSAKNRSTITDHHRTARRPPSPPRQAGVAGTRPCPRLSTCGASTNPKSNLTRTMERLTGFGAGGRTAGSCRPARRAKRYRQRGFEILGRAGLPVSGEGDSRPGSSYRVMNNVFG